MSCARVFRSRMEAPETLDTETAMKLEATEDVQIPVPIRKLTMWNVAMCVFHTILMVVTLSVGNLNLKVPIYGTGVQLETLANNTRAWALKPDTSKTVGWFHMTWLVALFFLLSALAHFGNALIWRSYYIRALQQAYAPFRWMEYSGSASVMILILSYTSGTILNPVLVALFALTFITMLFGHLHEVCSSLISNSKHGEVFLSLFFVPCHSKGSL